MSRLVLLVFVLLAIVGPAIPKAGDCAGPCPGTLPAIWPDRSAPLGDTVTIYGWNLAPQTSYTVAVIEPDGGVRSESITTDAEGTLLNQPFIYLVADQPLGVYTVRLYDPSWGGDTGATPIAATTFFHNNFRRN